VKKIKLTQGKYALVDDKDFKTMNEVKWYLYSNKKHDCMYAMREVSLKGKKTNIWMHRLILGAPRNKSVDHINGNGLDNRRKNLRLATHSQNMKNRKINKNNTSGYKGVCWNVAAKAWVVYIGVNGEKKYEGMFDSKLKAHQAYVTACQKYHGTYARVK